MASNWEKAEKFTQKLQLSSEAYTNVSKLLLDEMEIGLSKDKYDQAVLKMLATYVRSVPDGSEKGKFLGLDLGGTNFRVLVVNIDGKKIEMQSQIFAVPQNIMTGTGAQLFDHIAECIATFLENQGLKNVQLPLGFTFSFPCRQTGLTASSLIKWTKGFTAKGVEGEDVVKLLFDAVNRRAKRDFNIDIVAVVNDTTGTLMSCAHDEPACNMGVIVGTGTNACYIEQLENVKRWDGDFNDPKEVLINMEWGALGDNNRMNFARCDIDEIIDRESINPGFQKFEKMISGMYMGELTRILLVQLAENKLLFNGVAPESIKKKNSFFTKYVSEIEAEKKGVYTKLREIFNDDLGVDKLSDEECKIIRHACECVSRRAAFLTGATIATVLNKMNEKESTVGVDGSVYRFHPHFHNLLVEQIGKMLTPGLKFKIMLSEDGSGKGAALVAAVAVRLAEKKHLRLAERKSGGISK